MKSMARYWAYAEDVAAGPDGIEITRCVRRGSDVSVADAQRRADAALPDVLRRVRAGEDVDAYPYGVGTLAEPIEEEFFATPGERAAAVTVNRMGCRVLNAATLGFVDVDLTAGDNAEPWMLTAPKRRGLFASLRGKDRSAGGEPAPVVPHRGEERALASLEALVRARPRWGVRAYRTAAGLRYLVVNPALDPCAEETHAAMKSLGVDPLYASLCKAQRCFRARLTPKPWRQWAAQDRKKIPLESIGVCAWIGDFGRLEAPDDMAARLIALHDGETVRDGAVCLA